MDKLKKNIKIYFNKYQYDNFYHIIKALFSIDLLVNIIFIFTLLVILIVNIKYSALPILEEHGFRQTQTALTSFYLKKDGFSFSYDTPVLGKSWSIPFEFPIYQEIVALVSNFLNISLTIVGRVISLLFTVMSCIPIYLTLNFLGFSKRVILFSLSLFLSTPLYIFWSGTFMMESTALFFTLFFIYYGVRILKRDWTKKNYILMALFLLLALLQKITTPLPVLIVFIIIFLLFSIKLDDLRNNKITILKIFISVFLAILISIVWLNYTDTLKLENPIGKGLTSYNLREWNYGSFDQRLSKNLWVDVILNRVANKSILGLFGLSLIFFTLLFIRSKNYIIFILLILFFLPFILFTNLHIVHNYYQVANSIFLIIAAAISICLFCDKFLHNHKFLYSFIIIFFIFSNLFNFYGNSFAAKKTDINLLNNKTLAVANYIKSTTDPNKPVIWFGFDWSSEAAFYSERRSLTVPSWGNLESDVIQNTAKYLGEVTPSSFVLCPSVNLMQIKSELGFKFPNVKAVEVQGCYIYIL